MTDFLSKFEFFLFDILGLILPGLVLIGMIVSPTILVDLTEAYQGHTESVFLSGLKIVDANLRLFLKQDLRVITLILFAGAYIIGHTLKVLSIIQYELSRAIMDNLVLKILEELIRLGTIFFNLACTSVFYVDFNDSVVYKHYKKLRKPLVNTFRKVFYFDAPNYFDDNQFMLNKSIDVINEKFETNFPTNSWYSFFKLSSIVNSQENIKSMSSNFLAKYNLYRSLAFVFIVVGVYYAIFFHVVGDLISSEVKNIELLISVGVIILWFTFHYKFKRYWTLCGNENLVSLYYFLNKGKLKDG